MLFVKIHVDVLPSTPRCLRYVVVPFLLKSQLNFVDFSRLLFTIRGQYTTVGVANTRRLGFSHPRQFVSILARGKRFVFSPAPRQKLGPWAFVWE